MGVVDGGAGSGCSDGSVWVMRPSVIGQDERRWCAGQGTVTRGDLFGGSDDLQDRLDPGAAQGGDGSDRGHQSRPRLLTCPPRPSRELVRVGPYRWPVGYSKVEVMT